MLDNVLLIVADSVDWMTENGIPSTVDRRELCAGTQWGDGFVVRDTIDHRYIYMCELKHNMPHIL